MFAPRRIRSVPSLAALLLGMLGIAGFGVARLSTLEAHKAPPPPPAVGDTTVIDGPRAFTTASGSQVIGIEQITTPVAPATRYLLQVQNGGIGAPAATGGSVRLNGTTIVSSSDLAAGAGTLTREVLLNGTDTLVVVVSGTAGSTIRTTILATADPTVTVFGPKTYIRPSGASPVVTDNFTVPDGVGAPFTTYVQNGTTAGDSRASSASVTINGVEQLTQSNFNQQIGSMTKPVSLSSTNTVGVQVESSPGNRITVRIAGQDIGAPILTITAPAPNLITKESSIAVSGTVTDLTAVTVKVNGVAATITNGSYSATVPLAAEGSNTIHVIATDAAGNTTDSTRTVIRDTQAPALIVAAPANGFVTKHDTIFVRGSVADANPVTVSANGTPLPVDGAGQFVGSVPLVAGANYITVVATDAAGNTTTVIRSGIQDNVAPELVVSSPAEGTSTTSATTAVVGTVTDVTAVTVTVNGVPATLGAGGAFSTEASLDVGSNTITVIATDAAGNATTVTRTVIRQQAGDPIPPDPSTVAPALKVTEPTTPFAAAAFLYSGTNPIQTGVAPGTILPARASVIRGTLIERTGEPLPGARVTVVGHPEFGRTVTRADGGYDLVVNGGGPLAIHIEKAGYLPADRQLGVDWQDYPTVDAIALVKLDPAATVVDFTTAAQSARGSVTNDSRGSRRATLVFSQGTTASLVLPDGSTQPVPSLTIRATEYTVGRNGNAAMPAPLPVGSAYTYAVELSADEAIAAGATSVTFSKSVAVYVDNFLNFNVGGAVPVGYYDRVKGAWIASRNGRVIKVLDVSGGSASLDVDGSGQPASPAALVALGVDAAELARIASFYTAGQTIWRFQVDHFSPWDANWPEPVRVAALTPNPKAAETRKVQVDLQCEKASSVIGCEKQTLGEVIPVAGTNFDLVYTSERVAGFRENNHLDLDLGTQLNSEALAGLTMIRTHIYIAGRHFVDTFPPTLGQRYQFVWDGKDAYGRVMQGAQRVRADLEYVYLAGKAYSRPDTSQFSFGKPASDSLAWALPVPGSFSKVVRFADTYIGGWDNGVAGFGGWTLSAHHAYDPIGQTLYAGDGTQRSARSVNAILTTVAGTANCQRPDCNIRPDGVPATSVFANPGQAAVAPDGTIYLLDNNLPVVWAIARDGTLRRFAGSGSSAYSGDGGPALLAGMSPIGIRGMPDGSLIIADDINHRLRRIDPSGLVSTIAGTGVCGDGGDGGPATLATLCFPQYMAVAADGTIYLSSSNVSGGSGTRIRRIAPDGTISTYAGKRSGSCFYTSHTCRDSVRAQNMVWGGARGLALGPDGSLYVADNANRIVWNVGVDGIVRRVAGDTNTFGADFSDGRNALVTNLNSVLSIEVGPDGSIYTGGFGTAVRRIGRDGIVTTVAGAESCGGCFVGGGAAATQTSISFVTGLTFGPDGRLYISDLSRRQLRRLEPPIPGFSARTLLVPSDDGKLLFKFDSTGRHLATMDATTGHVLLAFGYDPTGSLDRITDDAGNIIAVSRTSTAINIVSPYGETTTISLRPDGLAGSVTTSGSQTTTLDYQVGGLLSMLRDPEQREHNFTYDSLGRLHEDRNPSGRTVTLSPTIEGDAPASTATTNNGEQEKHRTERLPNGGLRRTTTDVAGLVSDFILATNDSVWRRDPNGMVSTITLGADPRFGAATPILRQETITTPSGKRLTVRTSRVATLSEPGNALSLTSLVDSVIVGSTTLLRTELDVVARTITSLLPSGRSTQTQLDTAGRVVAEIVPGIATRSLHYDSRGRVDQVVQGTLRETVGFDAKGRVATIEFPHGQSTAYSYDSAGNVSLISNSGNRDVAFEYNRAGQVISITPSGSATHRFAFEADGLIKSYTPPLVGGVAIPTTFAYRADRRIDRVQYPTGSIALDYSAGRVSSITLPTGTRRIAYDLITGQVSSITMPDSGRIVQSYDGELLTNVAVTGIVAATVSISYDNLFRMRSLALGPDSVTYDYNADGQIIRAGALNAYRSSITGLVDSTRLSAVGTAMAYDNLGSVVSRTVSGIVGGPFSNTYTRDSLGRITTATERFGSDSVRLDYGYDSAGRLATVNRNGAVEATYEYDPNGNRRLITTSSGIASAAFDAQDRQLSLGATTYSYDANGARSMRVVGADTTRYTYDVVGNLLRVDLPNGTRIDYIVDGQNRRIGKRVNGALVRGWVYQSQLAPIAELDASNQVIARFVYGALPTVPEYMVKNGITYRIISDHLGSVRLVVDVSTGIVAQRIDYDAFGREVGNTNPGFQPFGYAGGLVDEQTSLVRLGVRDYDPEAGRWTAKDPLLFFSNSTNLYAYVENDPINLVDPTGLQSLEDWANYAAGFGDFFTFGLTNWIRDKWDANDTIDRCSGWYIAGDATGFAMDIALGGAIGLEKAGAKAAGKEFSHWIPNRMGGPRSIFNGNFVTPYRHFLHDPYRYIKGWRDLGPRFPRWLQQLDRIPNIYKGLGAGAALGAVTEALRPCKCRN